LFAVGQYAPPSVPNVTDDSGGVDTKPRNDHVVAPARSYVSVRPSTAVSTTVPSGTNWPATSDAKKLPPKALTPPLKLENTMGL